jgi:hypothetical protein
MVQCRGRELENSEEFEPEGLVEWFLKNLNILKYKKKLKESEEFKPKMGGFLTGHHNTKSLLLGKPKSMNFYKSTGNEIEDDDIRMEDGGRTGKSVYDEHGQLMKLGKDVDIGFDKKLGLEWANKLRRNEKFTKHLKKCLDNISQLPKIKNKKI